MTEAERRAALEAIAAEVRACTRCRLHEGRTKAVPGEGSASTEVVFVGEGPGFNEDRQGRPFVGRAGERLTEWIESVGWRRQDVFITNIVKCRPPDNRDPGPDEIAACMPFLRRQLEALDPALVVTLGRFSMGAFMPGARITQVHGTTRPADPSTGASRATTYAMYHPAAALRSPEVERQAMDDMQGVPLALLTSRERAQLGIPRPPDPAARSSDLVLLPEVEARPESVIAGAQGPRADGDPARERADESLRDREPLPADQVSGRDSQPPAPDAAAGAVSESDLDRPAAPPPAIVPDHAIGLPEASGQAAVASAASDGPPPASSPIVAHDSASAALPPASSPIAATPSASAAPPPASSPIAATPSASAAPPAVPSPVAVPRAAPQVASAPPSPVAAPLPSPTASFAGPRSVPPPIAASPVAPADDLSAEQLTLF